MPDYSETQKDYARYRLDKSAEDLESAKLLLEHHNFRGANNRAYYAIFHALRAVLVLDNYDSKKHSGIIGEFRRRYIKTGILPVEMSEMIGNASMIRNASDYDDMFIASRVESEEQIENAQIVYRIVKEYLDKRLQSAD